jgi:hypothetical protein
MAALLGGVAAIVVAVAITIKARPDHGSRLAAGAETAVMLKARAAIESGAASYLGGGLACGVKLLGVDPPQATRMDEVATAYVWVVCGTVDGPTESSLPVAVHFADPPTADVPGDGTSNEPDKKRIFPERLWDLVMGGPADTDALTAQMNQRRQELTPPR